MPIVAGDHSGAHSLDDAALLLRVWKVCQYGGQERVCLPSLPLVSPRFYSETLSPAPKRRGAIPGRGE
jgi:hypothetical protein